MISNYSPHALTNIIAVKMKINEKQNTKDSIHLPYAGDVITEQKMFPHNKWYKGIPFTSDSVFSEREAGISIKYPRIEIKEKLSVQSQYDRQKPDSTLCFQPACSTIFPCQKDYVVNSSI